MSNWRQFEVFLKRGGRGAVMLLLISLLIVCYFSAQVESTGNHDPNTVEIDSFMETAMNKLQIPGASLGIVKGDQTIYLKGYGKSGPDGMPVTPQTSFVIGSTSKSFTALAVMQLVDEGKIELDAPVQQYLPWFHLADEEESRKIAVKHLLYQTSGLSTYDGRISLTNGDKSIEQHLKSLKNTELIESPGALFQYSNLNYDILSGIVQAVSEKPFSEYMKEYIFRPLDMNNSYANYEEARRGDLATGYQPVFGFMAPTKQLKHEATVASGYLISSAEDMTNYLIAQMNAGQFKGKMIASEESIKQLHKPSSYMWGESYYAMGWVVNQNVIFHDGATENTYSKMMIDGEYGIILLINAMDNLVSYDAIISEINKIVQGQKPSLDNLPSFIETYFILDLILIIVLAFMIHTIYGLFKWKTGYKVTFIPIIGHVISILLFNILIPAAVILWMPTIAPWQVITVFLPGPGHILSIAPVLLLCLGVVKIVLIIRKIRNSERTYST